MPDPLVPGTASPVPVVLGPRAATTCARATHNEFDRTVPRPVRVASPARDRLLDAAAAHREDVAARWARTGVPLLDLRHHAGDPAAHVAATLRAVAARCEVVVGARLPDDVAGGRSGRVDALVRDPGGGYHPCRTVRHKVLAPRSATSHLEVVRTSRLGAPAHADAVGSAWVFRPREDDAVALAHHWRVLQACGLAAPEPRGGLIGTDGLGGDDGSGGGGGDPVIAWRELDEPRFGRDGAQGPASALGLHDDAHAARQRIAQVAGARTGHDDDPAPVVDPVGRKECTGCWWESVCIEALPVDDLSRVLRGTLFPADYAQSARAGIRTVEDLAALPAARLVTDDKAAQKRWAAARTSAGLVREGLVVRRRPGRTPDVPRTAVEVDLDVESSADGRVYLWGALLTTAAGSAFHPFADLDVRDGAGERDLLVRCLTWLADEHPGATVFHYSAVERTAVRRILATSAWAGADRARGTSADPTTWVDLLPPVRGCLDSRSGHGLKVVAVHGAGFAWRDEAPDGWESQTWLEQARAGDAAAARRLLEYNEDDVRATLAVRDWLSPRDPA